MTERRGLLEPYQQACEEELQEVIDLVDAVINSFAEGRHSATGPVRDVTMGSGDEEATVPIKVTFEHTMYNVGKIQYLRVYGVTPKQADVELGRVVRTQYIGHTIGELPSPLVDICIGQGEDAKKLNSAGEIFADEDAQKLLDVLRQYSS